MIATYISILRRRAWLIVALAVLLAPLGYFGLTFGPDEYRSDASLLIGGDRVADRVLGQGGGFEEPERRMANELQVFESRGVTVRAAEDLAEQGWDEEGDALRERVEAAPVGFSRAVGITGTDTDPERARQLTEAFVTAYLDERQERRQQELTRLEADLVDRLADAEEELTELDTQLEAGANVAATREVALTRFQTTAGWLEEIRLLQAGSDGDVQVLSGASTPMEPENELPGALAALLAVLGASLLAAGLALLIDLVRDAVRTPAEAERLVAAPVLAEVPRPTRGTDALAEILGDPRRPTTAAARTLRLRLEAWHEGAMPGRVLVASGTDQPEDALLVGAALAAACGRVGRRTLLVADMGPNAKLSPTRSSDRSTNVGRDVVRPDAPVARATKLAGVWSVPASARRGTWRGEVEDGLLDGFTPGAALDAFVDDFDVIVMVPPADAGVFELISLRRLVDTFALVCALGKTPGRPLRQAARTLRSNGAPIDGIVLTSGRSTKSNGRSSPPPRPPSDGKAPESPSVESVR